MAKTKETPTSTPLEQFIAAYKALVSEGKLNITPFDIAQKAELPEADFYLYFANTEEAGKRAWALMAEAIRARLEGSETFKAYSAREKILAYYFTFFEMALPERTFVEKTVGVWGCNTRLLKDYRQEYRRFMEEIISEGIQTDEIKERLSLSKYYPDVLWELHLSLLRFWLNDTSEQFVNTERAIEVYAKVPLELMGNNILDSVFESLKFRFENIRFEKFNFDNFAKIFE